MKEVTEKELYDFIGQKNVVSSVEGEYPYTIDWRTRSGVLVARKVTSYPDGAIHPLIEKYYIKRQ